MANIEGIGGVFIKSNQAKALADWYRDVLGVETESMPDGRSFYKVFNTRDFYTSQPRENPVFAIEQTDESLDKSSDHFTLNLRVDNLDEFLGEIKGFGVETEGKMLIWERGKHHWIRDPDSNRIELYEEISPND
jgi:catechol 2,3-dioxygenase-like lactoylglutathione lyase family enzyme